MHVDGNVLKLFIVCNYFYDLLLTYEKSLAKCCKPQVSSVLQQFTRDFANINGWKIMFDVS